MYFLNPRSYMRLIKGQEDNFDLLVSELEKFGNEREMEVLGYNGVSVAISLERFSCTKDGDNKHLVELGSRLFRRNISGPRFVRYSQWEDSCEHSFQGRPLRWKK